MEVPSKRVLVADADEIVLVLISHVLRRYRYTVDQCRDGSDLESILVPDDRYDALLIDLRVTDGSLPRLIDAHPALARKLIVLTRSAEDGQALDGLPVAAVLRKPVELYELLDTVRTVSSGA